MAGPRGTRDQRRDISDPSESFRWAFAKAPAIFDGKSPHMAESQIHRDTGDILLRLGAMQCLPDLVEARAPQIRHRRNALVPPEMFEQGPAGDAGSRRDVGKADRRSEVGFHVIDRALHDPAIASS